MNAIWRAARLVSELGMHLCPDLVQPTIELLDGDGQHIGVAAHLRLHSGLVPLPEHLLPSQISIVTLPAMARSICLRRRAIFTATLSRSQARRYAGSASRRVNVERDTPSTSAASITQSPGSLPVTFDVGSRNGHRFRGARRIHNRRRGGRESASASATTRSCPFATSLPARISRTRSSTRSHRARFSISSCASRSRRLRCRQRGGVSGPGSAPQGPRPRP